MKTTLKLTDESGTSVSEMILGQNIEACITTVNGLLSDRLRNAKLTGPPHRMTGIAPEWYGASCGRVAYELAPGTGLLGSDAQLIRASMPNIDPAFHQNRIHVKQGETLEFEIWARAWHEPVSLRVSLCPIEKMLEPYAAASMIIDKPYFARYTVLLEVPRDDETARLSIVLPDGGEIWIDQLHLRPKDQPLLCAPLIDEMKSMRIPALRFPGGIVTTNYNWKHGTGPVHLRPHLLEAAFHQDWYLNYDFGLDEYLEVCNDQEIRPTLTFNLATGTPEEAAELATYCANWFETRRIDAPMVYWHIGNHPYAYTLAHMSPDMYTDVLKTFVPIIKANYPNSRIVAAMSRAALDLAGADPWRDEILADASDLVDVVVIQPYGVFRQRPENPGEYTGGISDPDELIATMRNVIAKFEKDSAGFAAHVKAQSLAINIGAAEWNCWTQASHWDGRDFEETPDVLHGLFVAGMFHAFIRLSPYFEVGHFYNLVNCMGILNHRNADVEITCIVELFKLYRDALPGDRLELEIVEPNVDVDVVCLRVGDARYLFAINAGSEDTIDLDLTNLGASSWNAVCYCGTSLSGDLERVDLRVIEGRVELPPMSVTRVELG